MTQPSISIIIPVYNAEKWLQRCLDSALGQTAANIEVIAVDDASNDESPEILRNNAARDSRLKILTNEKNLGIAATRNRGIVHSKGQWLAFLDNDDFLSLDFCRKMLDEAERTNADIIKCRANFIELDGSNAQTPLKKQQDILNKSPLCFNDSWWTAIYRANKIRGIIRFHENIVAGEDLIFLVEAISSSTSLSCVNDALYTHIRREDSSTAYSNRSLKKIESVLNAGELILQTLNRKNIHKTDLYGYNIWVHETLRRLGGFHRAKKEEREKALRLCAARAPQLASLIQCDFTGINKFLMPPLLKILQDDRLMLIRLLIFRSYGLYKKVRKNKKH